MKMWTTAMITELGDTHRSPHIKRAVEMVSYTPVGERCQVLDWLKSMEDCVA